MLNLMQLVKKNTTVGRKTQIWLLQIKNVLVLFC